ncbi:MAG: response regulator [Desulfobacterales bacterium]|nr:response regulator [Desulfobacterales bacterium]
MGKTILVVDDNPILLTQMTRMLEAEGHKVATAKDGFSALNMLASLTPDVVFVDLIMPNIGGDNLCRLVRKMPHLKDCFLVVVSAAVVEQEFDYQRIGADACIAKGPFDLMKDHIREVIRESDPDRTPIPGREIRGIETVAVRRITQELLSKSHHLETVLETIPEGVVEVLEGKVVYVNSTAARLFQVEPDGFLGEKFTAFFPRRLQRQIISLLETPPGEVSRLGEGEPLTLFDREVTFQCLSMEAVNTKLVIITDVTKYKTVERALKEAMEYNENILHTMADSLVVLKPDLSISYVNRATCDMLGFSPHELFGKQIDQLFFEAVSFEEELFESVIRNGIVTEPSQAYRSKAGKRIPVSFLASAMYNDQAPKRNLLGIICIAHDLRNVEQLQQQLFQAEKIASFGVLAAGVAHEIKNPLAIILQGLETLSSGLKSDSGRAMAPDIIARIQKAALRANKIVEGLLDFSRQSPPEFVEADLLDVLRESLTLVEHHFKSSRVIVEERPADVSHRLSMDVNQIKQVFINIMVNAAEAMTSGGKLTIETGDGRHPDGKRFVQVVFADTGPGIAPELLNKIFEPFFTTKTKSLNTGLGLSVSQGIVERHRGDLRFVSESGKGTRVILTLPVE